MAHLTRRQALSAFSGLAVATLAAPHVARAEAPLTFYGPPAAPSAVLAHAVKGGFLKDVAPGAVFKAWKTPDEMRAAVANLHNRGLGLGLLNVLTTGLLYIVSKDGTLNSLQNLSGKPLALPFKNDMPDFVLRRLVAENGLKPGDIKLEYAASPPEAVQLLLTGRVDAALLSEPAATAVLIKAKSFFMTVHRTIDIQREWAKVAGKAEIPQAGLALTSPVQQKLGRAGIEALQDAMETALASAMADPKMAADAAADALGFPPEIIAASFSTSHLCALKASAARADLEAFYDELARADPAIIGGRRPDDGFYLV